MKTTIDIGRARCPQRAAFGKTALAAALFCATAILPSQAANLTHRWSFNGTTAAEYLADSIGGSSYAAAANGDHVAFKDGMAHLSGWANNSGIVNLGTGILGTGNVTIEIWAKKTGIKQWSRVFEYGPNRFDMLMLTWTRDTDPAKTSLALYQGGKMKIDTSYSGTQYQSETMYHISMTLSVNGNDTTVRWMRRNTRTGAIECEGTGTASGWTLADFSNPAFKLGYSNSGDRDANASYDEVRIYEGIVGDAQLSANAVAGPDALLATTVTDSASGFTVDVGATFVVSSPGATASVSGAATFGSGAKILFDTSSFLDSSATFSASSFTIADGKSLADIVEVTNPDWYEATASGSIVTVAPKSGFVSAAPVTATWNGGSSAPDAAALTTASNWICRNIDGGEIPGALPCSITTVIIPTGTTAFTIPDGYTPPWAGIRFGDVSAARYGKIQYSGERDLGGKHNYDSGIAMEDSNAWIDLTPFSYTTSFAQPVSSLSTALNGNVLNNAQMRFDGWINVAANQAGLWTFKQSFDDYIAVAIDGKPVIHLNAFSYTEYGSCYVTRGWHRFAIVCGDTWGGQSTSLGTTVSINDGAFVDFATAFTLGTGGTSTIVLADDCDWTALGSLTLGADAVIDLAGHDLKVKDIDVDFIGAMVTNTSSTVSTVYFPSDPYQTKAYTRQVLRGLDVNIRIMQFGTRIAKWTGAAGDGDVSKPGNWALTLDGESTSDTLPTADYTVLVEGQGVKMQVPSGTTLSCASFQIGNCTFAADCDWRGLSVTPSISGTVDLNGHTLQLNALAANSGSSFVNGAADTTSKVMFDVTQTYYGAQFSEQSLIDNIANLSTGDGVFLSLMKPDGAFYANEFLVGRSANVVAEFLQTNGTVRLGDKAHKLGVSSGNRGVYTMNGGTMTTGGSSEFQIGASGDGTFNLAGGDVTIGCWISVGREPGGNGTFNMTGGTLTVTRNNTPMWLGGDNGTGVFNFGGTATADFKGGIDIGRQYNAKGYLNMDGGTLTVSGDDGFNIGRDAAGTVVQNGGTLNVNSNSGNYSKFRIAWGNANDTITGSYTLNGGTANVNADFIIGGGRIATYVQNGGKMNANNGVTLASDATSKATVTLAGGVFNTKFIKKGEGTLNGLTFDGGTVAALENVSDGSAFFDGISSVNVGTGGMTFDTAGYDVAIDGLGMTHTAVDSSFTKAGDGTLTMDVVPATPVVVVSNGTLEVKSAAAAPAEVVVPGLVHRWSFNGETDEENLADSVGSAVGTKIGEAVTFENGEAVMSGNGYSAGSLNLGTGLLGTGDGATIEIWATRTDIRSNARVFDYGTDTNNFFMLAWNFNYDPGTINFRVRKNGGTQLGHDGGVPWTTGEKCHLFITFKMRDDEPTKPRIGWFAYDDATGRRLNADEFDINSAELSLADLADANFYLGHSQFAHHYDAHARYDEVRIWNGVLPQSAMEMSAVLGPDATASQLAGIGQNSANGVTALAVAQGATLDIAGVSLAGAVVSGGGTVKGKNGTLTAIGELRAKLGECLVIDGGTFNIGGVKVVFDAEDLTTLETSHKSYTLARAVNGGRIVGSPLQPATDAQLPTGWHVTATSGSVTLFKGGMSIILR